jgi:hypothetical protein
MTSYLEKCKIYNFFDLIILYLFIIHLIKMSLTKSYVKKLIDVRDAYEDERGHDPAMDTLVRDTIIELFMHANRHGEIQTANWCHEQLERERARHSLRPMDLVPSGILDAHDAQASSSMRRPSANPDLSALGVYDWNPNPRIPVQRHSFPQRAAMSPNPFSRDAPAFVPNPFRANAPAFVPNPFRANAPAFNPDANVRCNRCGQLGHRRAACTNPAVPGHRGPRGGKTRTNKHKKHNKGKKSQKH